jgi:hypothetical protein
MIASIFWYLIPVWVLLFLLLLLGVFAILSRIKGGRYARPIIAGLMKVPLLGRGLRRLSESAMERSNPLLASAIKKLERAGAMRDPQRMQRALSLLSSAERRAWMEAADQQQQSSGSDVSNRQIRRQLERQGLQQKSAKDKAKDKPKDKRKGKKKKKGEAEEERRGPQGRKRGKPGRKRGR